MRVRVTLYIRDPARSSLGRQKSKLLILPEHPQAQCCLRSKILDMCCPHSSGLLRYAFTIALIGGVIWYG